MQNYFKIWFSWDEVEWKSEQKRNFFPSLELCLGGMNDWKKWKLNRSGSFHNVYKTLKEYKWYKKVSKSGKNRTKSWVPIYRYSCEIVTEPEDYHYGAEIVIIWPYSHIFRQFGHSLDFQERSHPITCDTYRVVVWGHFCPILVPICGRSGPKYDYLCIKIRPLWQTSSRVRIWHGKCLWAISHHDAWESFLC